MTAAASLVPVLIAQSQQGSGSSFFDTYSLVVAIVLIAAGLLLMMAEVFVPGGVLGVLGVVSMVAGVVFLFRVDTTVGLIGAIVAVLALPVVVAYGLRVWQDTPLGKALILGPSDGGDDAEAGAASPDTDGAHDAAVPAGVTPGVKGTAVTDLRPIGTCLLDGRREQCLATGGMIDAGRDIEVVAVDGMQIKVRAVRR